MRIVRFSNFSIPSDWCLEVELGRGDLDVVEHVVRVVPFDGVIRNIVIQDRFHLFGRSRGSLFEDGLLDKLVAQVVFGSVKYTINSGDVHVQAEIAKSVVLLFN